MRRHKRNGFVGRVVMVRCEKGTCQIVSKSRRRWFLGSIDSRTLKVFAPWALTAIAGTWGVLTNHRFAEGRARLLDDARSAASALGERIESREFFDSVALLGVVADYVDQHPDDRELVRQFRTNLTAATAAARKARHDSPAALRQTEPHDRGPHGEADEPAGP